MTVTEQFRVRDDNGNEDDAICLQPQIGTSAFSGTSSRPGLPEYWLKDRSSPLNMIDKDTFEIVATGKRVYRIP